MRAKAKVILGIVVFLGIAAILYLQWPTISGYLPANLPIIGRGSQAPSQVRVGEFPSVGGQPQVPTVAPVATVGLPTVPTVALPVAPTAPPIVQSQPQLPAQPPAGPGVAERSLETAKPLIAQAAQKGGSLWQEMTRPFSLPLGQIWPAIKLMPGRAALVWLLVLAFGGFASAAMVTRRFKHGAGGFIDEVAPFLRPRGRAELNLKTFTWVVVVAGFLGILLTLAGKGTQDKVVLLVSAVSMAVGGIGFFVTIDTWGEGLLNLIKTLDPRTINADMPAGRLVREVVSRYLVTLFFSLPLFYIPRFLWTLVLFADTAGLPLRLRLSTAVVSALPTAQSNLSELISAIPSKSVVNLAGVLFATYRFMFTVLTGSLIPWVQQQDRSGLLFISLILLVIMVVRHLPGGDFHRTGGRPAFSGPMVGGGGEDGV